MSFEPEDGPDDRELSPAEGLFVAVLLGALGWFLFWLIGGFELVKVILGG